MKKYLAIFTWISLVIYGIFYELRSFYESH